MSPAFRHFRDAIVSGRERVIKPEPRIYEIVLERTGLEPADLLFVDDSAANIAAAAAMGFHVHHFTDPAAAAADRGKARPALEPFSPCGRRWREAPDEGLKVASAWTS